jgi:hypothetical protein
MIKILITGDRDWNKPLIIREAIRSFMPCSVIQGGARGADSLAFFACKILNVDCKTYAANWEVYGRAARPIRNRLMLTDGIPDIVLAFHNNIFKSRGTKDMVKQALKRGITVRLYDEVYITGREISMNDVEYDRNDPNLFKS